MLLFQFSLFLIHVFTDEASEAMRADNFSPCSIYLYNAIVSEEITDYPKF